MNAEGLKRWIEVEDINENRLSAWVEHIDTLRTNDKHRNNHAEKHKTCARYRFMETIGSSVTTNTIVVIEVTEDELFMVT